MADCHFHVSKRLVLAIAVIGAAGVAGLFAQLRTHGFSARVKPSAIEMYVATAVRRLAIPPATRALVNPLSETPLRLAQARDHFADHCATCHGNDGSGKSMINAGLFPPAPDMRTSVTQGKSDGELLHIIREGVRFTGMPGWGGTDEENWKLVLFIRHLPHLSDEEQALMEETNHKR